LEAGIRRDDDPFVQQAIHIRDVESSPIYNFPYFTDRIAGLDNQRETVGVGKMWGGTSNHNGMLYERGLQYDWAVMEKAGGPQWSYENVLPILQAQENYTGVVALSSLGTRGDIDISDSTTLPASIASPIFAAAQAIYPQFTEISNLNADVLEGISTTLQLTMQKLENGNYIRESSSTAYLDPSVNTNTGVGKNGRKLRIVSESFVTNLIFHPLYPTQVIGADYLLNSHKLRVLARKEVILSGGTYNSPSILMRSGVGNCTTLAALNISCVFDSPYVGSNLQDHMRVQVEVSFPTSIIPALAATLEQPNANGNIMEGRMSTSSAPVYTDPSISKQIQPDTKVVISYSSSVPDAAIPVLYNLNWVNANMVPTRTPVIEFAAVLLRPKCTGVLNLASAHPIHSPQILHNYLCDPDDVNWAKERIQEFMNIASEMQRVDPTNAAAYANLYPTESMVNDTATFERILPVLASGYRHPTGTLKMSDFNSVDQGVVSGNLCVHGLQGVRVVDASIFPQMPSSNPQARVYTIAGVAYNLIQSGQAC